MLVEKAFDPSICWSIASGLLVVAIKAMGSTHLLR
jgi:hypothetical protein